MGALKVGELRALMSREGIPVPEEGSGKNGRVVKSDLILAIQDFQMRGVTPPAITVPVVAKTPTAELKKLTVAKLWRKCKKLGLEECAPKKKPAKLRKSDLIRIVRAAEMGIEVPVPPPAVVVEVEIPEKYSKIELKKLRSMCKKRKIKPERCKLARKELIAVLMEDDRLKEEKKVKKKETPKKKKVSKKKYRCGPRDKRKCPPPKVCDVGTGACVSRTKAGKLNKRARESREKKYGAEYYFDEEHGLVGREQDVMDHLEYWGLLPGEEPVRPPALPTPKKVGQCTDKDDPLLCDEGEVCYARGKTGKCVEDTDKTRKNRHILETADGRVIVGGKATIEKLQKTLGGTISTPEKKPKKKKEPKKPKTPRKPKTPKKKKKEPTTEAGLQEHIRKLSEEGGAEEDIARLEEALEKLKKKKKTKKKRKEEPKPSKAPPKPPSFRLEEKRQDIAERFSQCIAELS